MVKNKLISIICLLFYCQSAFPVGQATNFGVLVVRADRSGVGFVKFDQPLVASPASCISGGHTSHLSFDLNTPGGRAAMSVALTAHATGKKIAAWGTGTCDEYGLIESWNFGWINQ